MNICLNFLYLHIFLALLDRIFFVSKLPKVSYQFFVYAKFLKIPVFTEVSLYHKPNPYVQNFHNYYTFHCNIV